ncbi:MAG: hypothetical protein J6V88_05655 [Kiritimatiellae bacterium]|jgi:hypothetical protein|nr:hypothetical protein [Kiritimatiellia bacterium]
MAEEIIEEKTHDEMETEIRDTDIVFDCPYCNHNLAIDFRGAGLQTNCVNCGESVLVPIPDGMEISDLDLDQTEILKMLFATRRNLKTALIRISELEETIQIELDRKMKTEAASSKYAVQLEELNNLCKQQAIVSEKFASMVKLALSTIKNPSQEDATSKE